MTQAAAKLSLSERLHWNDFIKPWLVRLIFVGIGLVVGLYLLAPRQARAGDRYLPETYTAIPTGLVQLTDLEGVTTFLPVRIASTNIDRTNSFRDVGPIALDNNFVLLAQTRETTRATSYQLNNVRTPLELAVINGEGLVIAIQEVPIGSERVSIAENHRWALAAKTGTLAAYGIGVDSVLNPDSVQKLNF